LYIFKDTEFTTALQKEKAFKRFVKVIEKRDINLIDKNLYNHLHLHCGFIAHYSIHGFKAEYESVNDFTRFAEHFVTYPWIVGCGDRSYDDINTEMVETVKKHYHQILFEQQNHQKSVEITILKELAHKHGFDVDQLNKESEDFLLFDESGQGKLAI